MSLYPISILILASPRGHHANKKQNVTLTHSHSLALLPSYLLTHSQGNSARVLNSTKLPGNQWSVKATRVLWPEFDPAVLMFRKQGMNSKKLQEKTKIDQLNCPKRMSHLAGNGVSRLAELWVWVGFVSPSTWLLAVSRTKLISHRLGASVSHTHCNIWTAIYILYMSLAREWASLCGGTMGQPSCIQPFHSDTEKLCSSTDSRSMLLRTR